MWYPLSKTTIPYHIPPISGLIANPESITILSFCVIIPNNLPGDIILEKYAVKDGLAGTSGTKRLPNILN
jgi:hypothetical protein